MRQMLASLVLVAISVTAIGCSDDTARSRTEYAHEVDAVMQRVSGDTADLLGEADALGDGEFIDLLTGEFDTKLRAVLGQARELDNEVFSSLEHLAALDVPVDCRELHLGADQWLRTIQSGLRKMIGQFEVAQESGLLFVDRQILEDSGADFEQALAMSPRIRFNFEDCADS